MNTIPAEEITELFRKVIRGEVEVVCVGCSWDEVWCGDASVRIDGYEITIFNDCGELDYVDSVMAPDGRTGDFDGWIGDDPVGLLSPEEAGKMEDILESAKVVEE